MLQSMRDNFKKLSWALWLVIIAFIIGFSLTDVFRPRSLDESELLIIDGTSIDGREFNKQLLISLENYRAKLKDNFNPAFIEQLRLPETILNQLINSTILVQEAKRRRLSVSNAETNKKIKTFAAFQRDGEFVYDLYERLLTLNRTNHTEFEKNMKEQIMIDKLKGLLTATLVIDEATLKEDYKLEKDKAELDYILLKPEKIKNEIAISEKELMIYYNNHKEEFKTAEKRSGYIIAFNYNDFKKDIVIKEDELYKYWRENKDQFKVPGKTKVSRILIKYDEKSREEVLKKAEDILKGLTKDNFADQAKKYSQGEKAKDGGDLGYWGWKNLSGREVKMVESLKEGDISPALDTGNGFSILWVSEKVLEREEVYAEAKVKIRNNIEKEKLNTYVREKLTEIYDKIKDEKNIKNKAEKMGVKVIESELISSGQPIKGLDEVGYISRNLFSLKENEIAFPVDFFSGMAIVQLNQIKKPEIESFDNVKDRVKKEVEQSKKLELLFKESQTVSEKLNQMKDQKNIDKYLKKEELKLENATYHRGNTLTNFPYKKGLDQIIFSLNENQFSNPIRFKSSVIIVKLKSKVLTGLIEFEHDRKSFYEKKINALRDSYFNSYVMNIRQELDEQGKIRFNQKLFDEIKSKTIPRIN